MNTLDASNTPEDKKPAHPANTLLQLNTSEITVAIHSLIRGGTVEDVADQEIITNALAFIEHPTQDFDALKNHMFGISMILAQYGNMENQPPEINAIQYKLFSCAARYFIELIEIEHTQSERDMAKIKALLKKAKDYAYVLAENYNDHTAHARITILDQQLNPPA